MKIDKLALEIIENSLTNKNFIILYSFIIIIYITFNNKLNFIKNRYDFFTNEITKLIIIGITIYLYSINKMIGILFIMAFLVSLSITYFYKDSENMNKKSIENFAIKEKWCNNKNFNMNDTMLKDIIKLIDNLRESNIELKESSKLLIKNILNNIDKDIINCMPKKMQKNIKLLQNIY